MSKSCFFTLLTNAGDINRIRLLVNSLRTFGGKFAETVFLIFTFGKPLAIFDDLPEIRQIPISLPDCYRKIPFSAKIFTCAQAERIAIKENIDSLIWIGSSAFFVQPPQQFDLEQSYSAAFRPVHHRNIGMPVETDLDDFWQGIYHFIGLKDDAHYVETFVESEKIRPYFNSHLFAIAPPVGILQRWEEAFCCFIEEGFCREEFCSDPLHRIFLHQALLSALLLKHLPWESLRILSPEYSYPLHLHHQVPPEKQPLALNELVCPVYEDTFHFPETLNGLKVDEPLAGWLKERMI
ncbi:MAG TPA: hypothetical protein PLD62_00515 [Candidatus Cloacimonadota bacterium]|nr:hypothetical protein [Candidatus Cloacimonadota bacterium]